MFDVIGKISHKNLPAYCNSCGLKKTQQLDFCTTPWFCIQTVMGLLANYGSFHRACVLIGYLPTYIALPSHRGHCHELIGC